MATYTVVIVSAGANKDGTMYGPVISTLDFDNLGNAKDAVGNIQDNLKLNDVSAVGANVRSAAVWLQTAGDHRRPE